MDKLWETCNFLGLNMNAKEIKKNIKKKNFLHFQIMMILQTGLKNSQALMVVIMV